jgi:3',5'-cyclic-AMP phosphodiesterase
VRRTARLMLAAWVALAWVGGLPEGPASAADSGAFHIVVLGDPHLPGRHLSSKQRVLKTINGWRDVDRVVVLGDICEDRGTSEEYEFARQFFAALRPPAQLLVGNHDYFYEDALSAEGRRVRGSPASRAAKLDRFRQVFALTEVYAARRLGPYLLLFLSTDDLASPYLAQMSVRQLDWLRERLRELPTTPTAIFFHAPLRGTLLDYNARVNQDGFVAQPAAELRELLRKNPQVFLWVAGHMHVSATNPSFRAPVNLFESQVMGIHAPDMERQRIWTTSLFFFPERVVVRTYDHKARAWIEELERTVALPRQGRRALSEGGAWIPTFSP